MVVPIISRAVWLDEASYFFFILAHWWLSYYFLQTTTDIGYRLEIDE